MKIKITNRYIAGIVHLICSVFVFLLFILVLLNFWYPGPFFSASGGWQGLQIVAFVDVVLGPLLTLVVFDKTKSAKVLFRDCMSIIVFQLLVLGWGVSVVYQQRPVAVAFWETSFYTVRAKDLSEQDIALDFLHGFGAELPVYVYVPPPQTLEDKKRLTKVMAEEGLPPFQQVDRFQKMDGFYEEIFKHSIDIDEVIEYNQGMGQQLLGILEENNSGIGDNYYIKLVSTYRNIILVFDKNNQLLGYLVAPFKTL